MTGLAFSALSGAPQSAGDGRDIEVTASVNADKIGEEDVLIYTITFKGINNPPPPRVDLNTGFRVLQTSRSSEFRFVNGVSSYYTNFLYYLTPAKSGTLTIPEQEYKYQDKVYKTPAFTIEVVKGSVAPPASANPRPRGFPDIFGEDGEDPFNSPFTRRKPEEPEIQLAAETSKKSVLKGEPVLFRVLLYTRGRIQSVNMLSNQTFPGFWQEWFPVPRSIEGERKRFNGRDYTVFEVRKAALYPSQTGKVTIPAMEFEVAPADDPFSFFSGGRPVRRSTKPIVIEVGALPANADNLPVGQFSFSVSSDKNEININEILTVRILFRSISGNLKTVEPPVFESTDYYKVYPAKINRKNDYAGDAVNSTLEAEIPVSFKKNGLISFPSLEFRYFDPRRGGVAVLQSKAFNITVTGEKDREESAMTLPQSEILKTGEDIDFIKKGEIPGQQDSFHRSTFFMLLMVILFGFNVLFLLKRYIYERYIKSSGLLSRKKSLNKAIRGIEGLADFGGLAAVLERYFEEKTGAGLSEINNQSIRDMMDRAGVSSRDADSLVAIKSQSESFRFSPQTSGFAAAGAAEAWKEQARQVMDILKRMDDRIKKK